MSHICYRCFGETVNEYGVCTACGYLNDTDHRKEYPLALPGGSILYGRYIVGRVLGQGGYGITYLAQDYQTKELVAIKEFFPDTMATRTGAATVTPFSGSRGEYFQYGKSSFLQEAQTMAEFIDNPNVAKVLMYFEENNTAYFVMEYVEGCSFEEHIRRRGGRLSWDETMQVMLPVLDTLSYVHEKGIIHRDIAPDNIFIRNSGGVKLLDFGAARHSLGNVSQSLDVIVKHGFAPKEQYSRRGRQGTYTDVYAASATIYFALTGVRPDDAIERSTEDTMPPPSVLGAKVSAAAEDALMKGLAVEARDRFQTAAELKKALTVQSGKTTTVKKEDIKKDDTQKDDSSTVSQDTKKQRTFSKRLGTVGKFLLIGVVAAALSFAIRNVTSNISNREKEAASTAATQNVYEEQPELEDSSVQNTSDSQESLQLLNTMASVDPEEQNFLNGGQFPFWGQTDHIRSEVETITFHSTMQNTPSSAWDVSERKDRSVLAWMDGGNLNVAADGVISFPSDSSCLFLQFNNVTRIDFGAGVDTSNVVNMSSMFEGCYVLEELDLSCFDTSKVTNMYSMFQACYDLEKLDLSCFDTSKVMNMSSMFQLCTGFSSLNLSNLNTSSVTNMSNMFSNCWKLVTLDLSDFDTSNVTNMSCMFDRCSKLTELDLSGFDTSNVTVMRDMFYSCDQLTSLNLSSFDVSEGSDLKQMFFECENLTELICSDDIICQEYEEATGRSVNGETAASETTAATEAPEPADTPNSATTAESQPYLRPHRFAGEYCIDCHVKLYSPEYFSSSGCPGSS